MGDEHTVYVLRLLTRDDVSADLRQKSLYCLWTDYGNTWYRSVVEECDPTSGTASLYVPACGSVDGRGRPGWVGAALSASLRSLHLCISALSALSALSASLHLCISASLHLLSHPRRIHSQVL